MQHEIPQSLHSTVRLLERSYPEGLSEDMLLPVLRLLYDGSPIGISRSWPVRSPAWIRR